MAKEGIDLTKPRLSPGWIIGGIIAVVVLILIVVPGGIFASKWLATQIANLTGGKINIKVFGADN
jgi:hypothetical protein